MTCRELQRVLADIMEGGRSAAQEAHLKSCPACSGLMSDLNAISQQARHLQVSEEPSPRVWNSIEIALRQERLIHQPQREPSLVPAFSHRWSLAWLLPVAAALLAFVTLVYERGSVQRQIAEQPVTAPAIQASLPTSANLANTHEDQQLLEVVGSRAPAMRAAYETNLQNVNAYIRDAEESALADPNDEQAQQSVMNAYQERAMVYEIALDGSLP
jgi:hypothetical protein